jgi:hypothetical protein
MEDKVIARTICFVFISGLSFAPGNGRYWFRDGESNQGVHGQGTKFVFIPPSRASRYHESARHDLLSRQH